MLLQLNKMANNLTTMWKTVCCPIELCKKIFLAIFFHSRQMVMLRSIRLVMSHKFGKDLSLKFILFKALRRISSNSPSKEMKYFLEIDFPKCWIELVITISNIMIAINMKFERCLLMLLLSYRSTIIDFWGFLWWWWWWLNRWITVTAIVWTSWSRIASWTWGSPVTIATTIIIPAIVAIVVIPSISIVAKITILKSAIESITLNVTSWKEHKSTFIRDVICFIIQLICTLYVIKIRTTTVVVVEESTVVVLIANSLTVSTSTAWTASRTRIATTTWRVAPWTMSTTVATWTATRSRVYKIDTKNIHMLHMFTLRLKLKCKFGNSLQDRLLRVRLCERDRNAGGSGGFSVVSTWSARRKFPTDVNLQFLVLK